ncbi:MAG: 2-dehydropantoate 2-reductase [Chloroflexi bacterium]|nr:2-dehydropantoate 2-reductase [Chloroflexota bacterium]
MPKKIFNLEGKPLTQKSVLIAGTGAVATLFAAKMGDAGYNVKMLGFWPEAVQAIRAQGVRFIDQHGITHSAHVQVSSNPCEFGPIDYALVLIKSWQTRKYARLLKECLSDDGIALTLQNGLGNREILAGELGEGRCLAGTIVMGATILQPGLVQLSGDPMIQLERDPRLDRLVEIFTQSGFQVETFDDLVSLRWSKLIINSGINPLSAVLGVTNGELAANPHSRSILSVLAREAAQTAAANGVKLPYDDPLVAIEDVIQRTAQNTSSMLQDLQRGAPTEIEAINGEIVRHAHRNGVSVPVNECFVSLVKAMVER